MRKRQAESDNEDVESHSVKKAKPTKSKPTKSTPAKASKSKPAATTAAAGTDGEGNPFWEIGGKRRVGISEFKGSSFINIREYYSDANGDMKPGKKGISLPIAQFQGLLNALPAIVASLTEAGHDLSVPEADTESGGAPVSAAETLKKPKASKMKQSKKSNIEETSEEEDDEEEEQG